jgi:DNA repair protein RadC
MRSSNVIKQKKFFLNGHRKRIYNKLEKQGFESLYDYEITEMLLFLVFKRKDTRTISKILIRKFGSIDKILSAPKEKILEIDGLGTETYRAFRVVNAVIQMYLKTKITHKKILKCFEDVISYCENNMKNLTLEELRVIYLNGSSCIIEDKIIQRGTIDTVELYTREIIKSCLDVGAKGIILVHNHPSGDPTPSSSDIYTTKKIKEAANLFNINLFDHIIIGGDRYVSFKALLIL